MNTFRKFQEIITPQRYKAALILLFLMLVGTALETLGIGLVIPALAFISDPDFVSKHPLANSFYDMLGKPDQATLVIIGMLGLIIIYAIKSVFLGFLAWCQARFTFGVQKTLSQRLFTGYLRQPYTFHLQRNSAQLIRNVMTETNQFTLGAMTPGMLLITETLVIGGMAGLLFYAEPLGAMVVITVLGVVSYAFHWFTKSRILRWGETRQFHDELCLQHLQQGLDGVKDVKLLGREDNFLDQYSLHNAGSMRMGENHAVIQALPRLWLELLGVAGLTVLVFIMIAQGKPLMSLIPVLGLFAAVAFRLMPSVSRIFYSVQNLRYTLPAINVLYSELQDLKEQTSKSSDVTMEFTSSLQLHRVGFIYPGGSTPVLEDINLTISKGSSVGFVGGSGAGKSTLLDLILGLLTPTQGRITVDGRDVQLNLRGWQDQIGYVPQDIFLMDDTLRRNVAFGLASEQIDEQAVQRAIEAACLKEFVDSLPEGLDTLVGERGVRLSGGQCQRIGIARALYHDPSVLVLDEASSALDVDTEKEIVGAIKQLKGKTILIVAHRLSTVEHCDTIVRLAHGRIVEEGSPLEVLARGA